MTKRLTCGFTLLEMLLAVAIFSMSSIIVYTALNAIIKSNILIKTKTHELTKLHRVISLLERDISHSFIYRTLANNNFGKGGIVAGIGVLDSDSFGIYILRNNKLNTKIFVKYQLEKLGYRLKDSCLERLSYLTLDNTKKSELKISCILSGVNYFRVRTLYHGKWFNEWNRDDLLPQSIEVTLDIKNFGIVRRVILLLH